MIHNRKRFAYRPGPAPHGRGEFSPSPTAVLDEERRDYSLPEAYRYCERMAQEHYENVPVASRFLPEGMRPHVFAIYAFARAADDFADEAQYRERRFEALELWGDELLRAFHASPIVSFA